mmetsp:Transcript_34930/g.84894  ORF Transcript_34930/g.84894 Transcript_34930/m.84894 type:complete len:209 (+) Transcript_34930:418-1044(+)
MCTALLVRQLLESHRWVECEHWKRCRDGLDPHVATCDTWENLLDRRPRLVRIVRLSRRLAARNDNNVVHRTPSDDLRHEHWGDEELGASVHGTLRVINIHHGPAPDHHFAVVLGTEVGDCIEAAWRSQRELHDLEPTSDGCFHCRRALLSFGCAQHCASPVLLERLEYLLERLWRLRVGVIAHRVLKPCAIAGRERGGAGEHGANLNP